MLLLLHEEVLLDELLDLIICVDYGGHGLGQILPKHFWFLDRQLKGMVLDCFKELRVGAADLFEDKLVIGLVGC